MFKKPLKVQQQTMLTGKDRKAFEVSVKKAFNSDVLEAFFKDNEQIQIEKLKSSKQVIYSTDSYPAFVDATGKGDFFPTLYIVSEYPMIIGEVPVKDGVESLILGGAASVNWDSVVDVKSLGDFNKDDVRAITSKGKMVALGAMGSESKNINTNEPAAYILHTIQDQLWEYGPKQLIPAKPQFVHKPKVVEKPQVQPQPIQKQPEKKVQSESSDSDEEDQKDNLMMLMGGLKSKVTQKKQSKQPAVKKEVLVKKEKVDFSSDEEDEKNKKKNLQKKKETKKPVEEEESKNSIPTKVMDEYIKEAFLNAIKVGINDKDLPLDSNGIQTQMENFKRENITLDFKASSYGKIGKFLQQMSKDGLIEYKEGKKGAQAQVESIDRSTAVYDSWEPTVLKAHCQDQDDSKQTAFTTYNLNIQVVNVYKPDGPLGGLFQGKDKEENFWTLEEVKKIVMKHCTVEKKTIRVNEPTLKELIANQEEEDEKPEQNEQTQDQEGDKKKKRTSKKVEKDVTTQDVLMTKVLENMTKYYQYINPHTKKQEIKTGEFKGIQIVAEKQHNKNVTVINGLEQFGFDDKEKADQKIKSEQRPFHPNHLLTLIMQKLDCQGSVQNGKQILLQGQFDDDLQDYFINELKVNAAHIHLNNKIAAKKKPSTFNK